MYIYMQTSDCLETVYELPLLPNNTASETSYVYWTMHLLFHYLMLSMFQMLIHPSSGACDLFFELFHGLYCSGSMCVGVTLWFGCGGVVSV